ncbi:hypothetical protein F25303_772 [Fusarium sp. NRRL 25303]|nr:hypothetical protein F25303_772 [Fusarium sp. NRRL 25303]
MTKQCSTTETHPNLQTTFADDHDDIISFPECNFTPTTHNTQRATAPTRPNIRRNCTIRSEEGGSRLGLASSHQRAYAVSLSLWSPIVASLSSIFLPDRVVPQSFAEALPVLEQIPSLISPRSIFDLNAPSEVRTQEATV